MNNYIKGILVVLGFILLCYIGYIFEQDKLIKANTSTPVEEMYHRQLVVTLDSILDARFGSGYCEEDNDTVSSNTFRTHFDDILSPMD